jgi:4-amino-4-deoxy-L-arabinose transferase-like glycosyltransferase
MEWPLPRTAVATVSLFLVAFLAALVFMFSYPLPAVENDANNYQILARNVSQGLGFSGDGMSPAVYRPPLFSGLLGGWFAATGNSSPRSATLFQSIVHAFGAVAALLFFLEIVPSFPWAVGSALFLAVNPLLVTRVVFVLQEPTLLLMTTLAAWASIRLIKAPSTGRAAVAGAAWGICTLAKVVAWFAPFLLLAMRFLPSRLRWTWRGMEAAALLFCFVAVIAPWTVRNYFHFHRFIPVNGQGEGVLEWNVLQADIPGESPGRDIVEEVKRENRTGFGRKLAYWEYMTKHPRYFFLERVIRNAVHFAAPPRDWWIARGHFQPGESRVLFWVLSALLHIPLYLLLLYRSLQWGKGEAPRSLGFLVLFYWLYWAEHAFVWGDARFGMAVYPLLVAMVLPLDRSASVPPPG